MTGNGLDFLRNRTSGQTAGIPTGHQCQIVRTQYIADTLGVLGELAVEFEAFVADLLAFAEGRA